LEAAEHHQGEQEEEDRWALHPLKKHQGAAASSSSSSLSINTAPHSHTLLEASPLLEEELDEYEQLLSMPSSNKDAGHVMTDGGDFELFGGSNKTTQGGAACSYDLRDHAQSNATVKQEYPNYGSGDAAGAMSNNADGRHFKQ
jgi:hypothetical protein